MDTMCEQNLQQQQQTKKRGRPRGGGLQDGSKEARKHNKKVIFNKRKPTLMNKVVELQTLCGVVTCLVCFGPNGTVDVWPEEQHCKQLLMSYKRLDSKLKKECSVLEFLEAKKKKLERRKEDAKIKLLVSSLANLFDGLSGNLLYHLVNEVESIFKRLKEKLEWLKIEKERAKTIQTLSMLQCSPGSLQDFQLWSKDTSNFLQPTGFEYLEGTHNRQKHEVNSSKNQVPLTNNDFPCGFEQVDAAVSPDKKQKSLDMGENPDNYFIPSNQQHQMSYLHDALPISVWNHPQQLVEAARSSESTTN